MQILRVMATKRKLKYLQTSGACIGGLDIACIPAALLSHLLLLTGNKFPFTRQ